MGAQPAPRPHPYSCVTHEVYGAGGEGLPDQVEAEAHSGPPKRKVDRREAWISGS